eukprot:15326198-Alexandrium_andersonii.AAC.2
MESPEADEATAAPPSGTPPAPWQAATPSTVDADGAGASTASASGRRGSPPWASSPACPRRKWKSKVPCLLCWF